MKKLLILGLLALISMQANASTNCKIRVLDMPEGTKVNDWVTTHEDADFELSIDVVNNYMGHDCNSGFPCKPVEGSANYSTVYYQLSHVSGWKSGDHRYTAGPHGITKARVVYSKANLKIMAKMATAKTVSRYESLKAQLDPIENKSIPAQNAGEGALARIGSCGDYL